MNLTDKQQNIVSMIDNWVQGILSRGGGDEEILVEMVDYMEGFKYLMDTLDQGEIDILCDRYDGFYYFAKFLENIAEGIAAGEIEVP